MTRAAAVLALVLSMALSAAAAEDAPKRRIDAWSGVLFFCLPDFTRPWTTRACARITEDVTARAAAAEVKLAVLEMTSEPQWLAKAEAAGFDGGLALAMLFRFSSDGGPDSRTSLDLVIEQPLDPKPGVEPKGFTTLVSQTTTIDPGEHPDEAVKAAATVWTGVLKHLTASP